MLWILPTPISHRFGLGLVENLGDRPLRRDASVRGDDMRGAPKKLMVDDGWWWFLMVYDGWWWLMMVDDDDDDGTYGSRILVARQSFRKLLTSQEKFIIGHESDSLYINFSVILLISLWVFPAPSLIGTCIFAGQWVNDSHIHWLHPNLITMNYPVVRRAKKHEGAMGIRIPCEMGSQGVTKSFRITW